MTRSSAIWWPEQDGSQARLSSLPLHGRPRLRDCGVELVSSLVSLAQHLPGGPSAEGSPWPIKLKEGSALSLSCFELQKFIPEIRNRPGVPDKTLSSNPGGLQRGWRGPAEGGLSLLRGMTRSLQGLQLRREGRVGGGLGPPMGSRPVFLPVPPAL